MSELPCAGTIDDYLKRADFWAWETDASLALTFVSPRFTDLTGVDPSDLMGRSLGQIIDRDVDPDIGRRHLDVLQKRQPFENVRYPLRSNGSETRWFESSGAPWFDESGCFAGYRGVARDVTAQTRERALLQASDRESKLQQTLLAQIERVSKIGEWRWRFCDEHVHWSDEVYRIYELPVGTRVTAERAFAAFTSENRALLERATERAISQNRHYDLTLPFRTDKGNQRWVRAIGVPEVVDGETTRMFGTFQDVTEQRERHLRMQRLAMTDALTGTANRAAFNERLKRVFDVHRQTGKAFALCVFDLNDFKQVNDHHGHDIGDEVLQRVAGWLKDELDDRWFFARIGGDEFAAVRTAIAEGDDVDAEMRAIFEDIELEIWAHGVPLAVSATVGYSVSTEAVEDAQAMLRQADLALYQAKRDSKSNVHRYDAMIARQFHRRVVVAREFRQALDDGQIVPHYQPVVELHSGRITGMEALARWVHPERGICQPDEFRTVFDNPKICIELTRVMLAQICRDMALWRSRGTRFGRIGLNVSAADLMQPGFALQIINIVSRHDLQPHDLLLEMTETGIFSGSTGPIINQMQTLLDAGVLIALDDFGTGYSSLTHLKSIPFNILKIDKSFIKDMMRSRADMAIVRSLIGLGRDLGYPTVAEGIESGAEAAFLRDVGCERGQGYHYHRPMPREQAEKVLRDNEVGTGQLMPPDERR